MIEVVLSVGSNCGDREGNVKSALRWLESCMIQVKTSSIYETPCAVTSGRKYLNAVVSGYYPGNGEDFEEMLKDKEKTMGRTAECREKGDVPIDIDVVILNGGIEKPWDFRQKFFQIGYQDLAALK